MPDRKELQFPYGAVYYRKSNPPREDWERDYSRAAGDGYNIFRHWLIWSAVETAPGVYDWSDYDRHFELAEKYGIQIVLAEITASVPAWAAARYPKLLPRDSRGNVIRPEMAGNSAVGGFPTGFCLDKPAAKAMAGAFLEAAARRYKGHPMLYGYDVNNECYLRLGTCYCEDTVREYRKWLRQKYKTVDAVNESWHIYSLTDFDDICPPARLGFFPDSVDWLQFRHDQTYKNIQWKIDRIRLADKNARITAHGMSDCFANYSEQCSDHWTAAKKTDIYGLTWVPCRKGNEPWRNFGIFDLLRSASGDTPFWHTEAQGGPLWLQPQLAGRPRTDGRVPEPEDIRIWNLMLMACGGSGILYTRYRPLLDGPLFGAFAPYAMDGGGTDRSKMTSEIALWANRKEQKTLWEARPAAADIHILFVPECETASFLLSQSGGEHVYSSRMFGAYEGFFSHNIQADFVHIDELYKARIVYFPYPLSLSEEHADQLTAWVKGGGILICESCPGFFTEHMHANARQPVWPLEELFGVTGANAEFMPDLAGEVRFELLGETVQGGGFIQTYCLAGAEELAQYSGRAIAVQNTYGEGKALLMGTALSACAENNIGIWRRLPEHFGIEPRVRVSDNTLKMRIHRDGDRRVLWAVNPQRDEISATVALERAQAPGYIYWNGGKVSKGKDADMIITVEPRNALVLELIEVSLEEAH